MTDLTNLFKKAEAQQEENITNATQTTFQTFEQNLKELSAETLNAITHDMKQVGNELNEKQKELINSLQLELIQHFQQTSAETLTKHQQQLKSQLNQLAQLKDEIETTSQHIRTLKESAQTVIYSQSDLANISHKVQKTAEQIHQSAQLTSKAKKGIMFMAGIAGMMALVIALMTWQAVRQSDQLATVKAELTRYGDQSQMIATMNEQAKLIESQKKEIQALTQQIKQAPQTQEQIKAQQERQHQLELERLRLAEEQQKALLEQQKAQQEAQAELARKRADQIAEQQRKAERDRQRQCEKNPTNRFSCN